MKEENTIYFNNSATSYPKAPGLIGAVSDFLSGLPSHAGRGESEDGGKDLIFDTRKLLAGFIHAPRPCNVTFTSGATESLNLAIFGMDYEKGHVITSSTEHNSVLRPLKTLERDGKISLSIVRCDKKGIVHPDDVARQIKSNTRAVIINHCSNVTGTVQDLEKISEIAHRSNSLFIVDASQSIGVIDINVVKSGIDILCFTGHKNLFGLQGTGGVYIKDGIRIKPLKVGGTGVHSDYLYQPETTPMFYEAGTPNMAGILSLKVGLEFIKSTGFDNISKKKSELFVRLVSGLKGIPEIVFYGEHGQQYNIPVIALNIKNIEPSELSYILQHSFNIITRSGLHCAPLIHRDIMSPREGNVRISLSYFNTIDEIDLLLSAISQIITESKK